MLKKACLIVDENMYDVMRHFVRKLSEAMERKGIATHIIDTQGGPLEGGMFASFVQDPPDFTCSFNTFEPLSEERFFWDIVKVPHLSFLVDPAIYSLHLTKSPYSILSCVDRSDLKALQTQFKHSFFFPHAIERDLDFDEQAERPYDVVFFGSCFDFKAWKRYWEQQLPPALCQVLDVGIDYVMSNDEMSIADALIQGWTDVNPSVSGQDDFLILFHYLDKYTRGLDRFELIRAIKKGQVHVFGESPKDNIPHSPDWAPYLEAQENVTLHPSVSYPESLDILKKSKICLNSMPFFRDGTHERVFAGLACGCLTISSESLYLREQLGEDLLYYQAGKWDQVDEQVNHYLADEKKRKEIVVSGRAKVMGAHTWDHRVETLIEVLPPILSQIHKKNKR